MADSVDFLDGDDLEAILDILEADEEMEGQFINEVENLQSQEILCQKCGKKYKTRGGYERHQASKHSEHADHEVPFDSAVLNELVNNTVLKLKENKAHSELLRQELSSYLFESPDEDRCHQLRDVFEGYTKNGSVEKFYGKYYATVAVNSVTFFRGLTRNA